MAKPVTPEDLCKVFAVLQPDMSASQEALRPGLYSDLDARYNDFENHSLVACYDFSADWGSWEQHPAGDEVVVLLSGTVTMVLWQNKAEKLVELTTPGSYVIVPRGIWHTARVSKPAKMLFITPGQNTQHGDSPSDAA